MPEMTLDELSNEIRSENDAYVGITSTLQGNVWLRDATQAYELNDERRKLPGSPEIEANNMLLRCLSRFRAIDYVIGGKGIDRTDLYTKLNTLLIAVNTIKSQVIPQTANKDSLEDILKLEKEFNTDLITILYKANLTKGCHTTKDVKQLLNHYRNLSSLLVPARTLVTITYDKQNSVIKKETQYPVTKKSAVQVAAFEKLSTSILHPSADEKNAHTVNSLAMQEADSCFVHLMKMDDRCLPAQARKTHLESAKNAFIVKNELFLQSQTADTGNRAADATLWFARTASTAYLGKGESKQAIEQHATENLNQIRATATEYMSKQNLAIHFTCLSTDSEQENQRTNVRTLKTVLRKPESIDMFSYVPMNFRGTFDALDVDPKLGLPSNVVRGRTWGNLATRAKDAIAIIYHAAVEKSDCLSVFGCQSAQDRGGNAAEGLVQLWEKTVYQANRLEPTHIAQTRAKGGNAAEIASHLVLGSPGIKPESIAENKFGEGQLFEDKLVRDQIYRKSANTNKDSAIGDVRFLKEPCVRAVSEYGFRLKIFENYKAQFFALEKLHIAAEKSLSKQQPSNKKLIITCDKLVEQIKTLQKSDPQTTVELNYILDICNKIFTCHAQHLLKDTVVNPVDFAADLARLRTVSKKLQGRASPGWQALGATLCVFASLALISIGVLAAIPSGGSSLLITGAGLLAASTTITASLSATTVISIAAGGAAATSLASFGLFKYHGHKGLSAKVNEFADAVDAGINTVTPVLSTN